MPTRGTTELHATGAGPGEGRERAEARPPVPRERAADLEATLGDELLAAVVTVAEVAWRPKVRITVLAIACFAALC